MSWILRRLRKEVNDIMTKRIRNFEGIAIAEAEDKSRLCAEVFEVADYRFLKLHIIGPLKVETFDGCELTFRSSSGKLKVESDSTEINTDFSDQLGIGITSFDIDLDDQVSGIIQRGILKDITIQIQRKTLLFKVTAQEELKKMVEQ